MRSINKNQVFIGGAALLLGLLIYLISRPLNHTYLGFFIRIPGTSSYWNPRFLNVFGGVLPSFLHVFAFSLLLGGLLACPKIGYLVICSAWLLIDVAFEAGQGQATFASRLIPAWFQEVFILQNLRSYFLMGTFDFYDLGSTLVGALAAYCFLIFTMKEG